MRPTLKDVARAAQVSLATASFVLRGKAPANVRISEETRMRVLKAAETLHYRVNRNARALRAQASGTVAVVVPDVTVPFFRNIVGRTQDKASSLGYSTVVLTYRSPDEERRCIDLLYEGLADAAVVLAGCGLQGNMAQLRELAARNVPLVVEGARACLGELEELASEEVPLDVVSLDWQEAARLAARHLVSAGCRRVLFVGGVPEDPDIAARAEAVRGEVGEGVLADAIWGPRTPQQAMALGSRILACAPDGIVAATDQVALGVLYVLHTAYEGARKPVRLVGIGNIPEDEWVWPGVTSSGPVRDPSCSAEELLFARLTGRRSGRPRVLVPPMEVFVRGT